MNKFCSVRPPPPTAAVHAASQKDTQWLPECLSCHKQEYMHGCHKKWRAWGGTGTSRDVYWQLPHHAQRGDRVLTGERQCSTTRAPQRDEHHDMKKRSHHDAQTSPCAPTIPPPPFRFAPHYKEILTPSSACHDDIPQDVLAWHTRWGCSLRSTLFNDDKTGDGRRSGGRAYWKSHIDRRKSITNTKTRTDITTRKSRLCR